MRSSCRIRRTGRVRGDQRRMCRRPERPTASLAGWTKAGGARYPRQVRRSNRRPQQIRGNCSPWSQSTTRSPPMVVRMRTSFSGSSTTVPMIAASAASGSARRVATRPSAASAAAIARSLPSLATFSGSRPSSLQAPRTSASPLEGLAQLEGFGGERPGFAIRSSFVDLSDRRPKLDRDEIQESLTQSAWPRPGRFTWPQHCYRVRMHSGPSVFARTTPEAAGVAMLTDVAHCSCSAELVAVANRRRSVHPGARGRRGRSWRPRSAARHDRYRRLPLPDHRARSASRWVQARASRR